MEEIWGGGDGGREEPREAGGDDKSRDKQWYYLIGVASSQKIYLELIY